MRSGGHSKPNPVSSPPRWCPWDLLRSVQMLKREWSAGSNGKLQHIFIPIKTAAGGLVAQAVIGACLPPLGPRVRVSAPPCEFRGGRNGVRVGFSRGFSRFLLPQISFHHISTLISSISFHFISPCDGASGVVGRQPCYSLTYNIGASSHLIPRPDLVLDTS